MKKVTANDPETLFERVTGILEASRSRVPRTVNQGNGDGRDGSPPPNDPKGQIKVQKGL